MSLFVSEWFLPPLPSPPRLATHRTSTRTFAQSERPSDDAVVLDRRAEVTCQAILQWFLRCSLSPFGRRCLLTVPFSSFPPHAGTVLCFDSWILFATSCRRGSGLIQNPGSSNGRIADSRRYDMVCIFWGGEESRYEARKRTSSFSRGYVSVPVFSYLPRLLWKGSNSCQKDDMACIPWWYISVGTWE